MAGRAIKFLACALLCILPAASAWANGAVYAMTNALNNNEVLVFQRAANGNLTLAQAAPTGGGGSGLQLAGVDSLGSAGSLQLDTDHDLLFAVNTESAAENNGAGTYNTDCHQGTITSFAIAADGTLTFVDRVFSGGLYPNSLAVGSSTLYVLNAGGPEQPAVCSLTPSTANTPNVTGFKVDAVGHMIPLDSTEPVDPGPATGPAGGESCTAASANGYSSLTGAPAADFQCGLNPPSFPRSPAQILLAPGAKQLVVTIKGTNSIYVFPIGKTGLIGANPLITQSPAPDLPTYFGAAFRAAGSLLVTEMFGSATSIPAGGKGALSSFAVDTLGHAIPISAHIGDGGTAATALAIEPITHKYVYVSNNLSASISSYTLASNGVLTLLNGGAGSGSGPNDLATAKEGTASFLYVLDAGTGTVGAYSINHTTGALTAITGGSGLPAGRSAQGLAAY